MSVRELPGTAPGTVCYLTKRFPRLSETFILDEILGLEAHGVPLRLFAVADPGESHVQPDVGKVRGTVVYLRRGAGAGAAVRDHARFLRGHATLFRRDPRRWSRTAWTMATRERSMALARHFLEAGGMAREMERVDGVHLHAAFAHGPASIAYYVHQLTGVPFSFAAHAKDLYLSSPPVLAMKIEASTFVLACSQSATSELRRIAVAEAARRGTSGDVADKVILAPHGVDVERFHPGGRSDGVDHEGSAGLRIVAVGRLVPKKGYPVLLDALADLARRKVDVECRIVGGGDLRDALAARVAALGLEGVVTFLGSRTQTEVLDEYREADVFVQASVITDDGDRDGIPNSVLEAMACGLPVVATEVAGIPEVVHDGTTGLLVRPEPRLLADALQSLAEDPRLRARLGDDARRLVVARYARRTCVELPAALLLDRLSYEPVAGVLAR
ncbi:MAG TPA: glycosyltransferase [Acidimicrobiales bacterium]